jgi:hypothetical protein
MIYPIIQPPFTLVFREMSKKELHDYNEWFHKMRPERIAVMTSAIKSTPGYETWEPDCSPESLEPLGEWFRSQIETRPRTSGEIDEIQKRSKTPINVPGEELTNKTFSLAMDIGMYLSEVFLKKHPALEWCQPLRNKKAVDYGQPVLTGFGAAPFNPVRMTVTLAYGLASQAKTGKSLREIYNIWSHLASGTV